MSKGHMYRVRYRGVEYRSLSDLADAIGYSAIHVYTLFEKRKNVLGHPIEVIQVSHPRAKAVRCIETGKTYGSITEACAEIGMRHSTFTNRLHKGKPTDGKHYRFV